MNNTNYGNKINSGILKEKNQFKGINMSQLTDIIAYAKTSGAPEIATMIQEYYVKEKQRRSFGLAYEHHMPEVFEISHHKIRKGDIVSLRSERGEFAPTDSKRWLVTKIYDHEGGGVADLKLALIDGTLEQESLQGVSVDRLIKTVSQDEVIYPALRSDGEVIGDVDNSLYHSVICSENYDALRMLTSTDLIGKVDCIYIDPPYNTGNKDWIYNNDYVDGSDEFRSSAFMNFLERRLKEAKLLLNPHNSVLILTIDEKEDLHVGMLLRQVFPEARIQKISTVINSSGAMVQGLARRVDEYIYIVLLGDASIEYSEKDMLGQQTKKKSDENLVRWDNLRRRSSGNTRSQRPNQFYPIFVDAVTHEYAGIGKPAEIGSSRHDYPIPEGKLAVWPVDTKGNEQIWGLFGDSFVERQENGAIHLGEVDESKEQICTVTYLQSGPYEQLLNGELEIVGKYANGRIKYATESAKGTKPVSVWMRKEHDSSLYGTILTNSFHGEGRFDFPKSLYLVEDTIRFFVKSKPNATIIDFFGGSGTTAHAVMRLNEQDGGSRNSITITNNEVSLQDNKKFSLQGLQSGDPDWEKYGVYEYATKPRITAAITGKTAKSNYTEDVQGYYKYNDFQDEYLIGDPIPKDKAKQYKDGMKQNVRFFYLDYLKYNDIYLGLSDNELYNIIWLEQGQKGEIPQYVKDHYVGHSYIIIRNVSLMKEALNNINDEIRTIYVHGDKKTSQQVHRSISPDIDVIPLWDLYINRMKSKTIK